jgi:hypothetical protein
MLDAAAVDAAAGQIRRPPRWEPAYVAALARIGLHLGLSR